MMRLPLLCALAGWLACLASPSDVSASSLVGISSTLVSTNFISQKTDPLSTLVTMAQFPGSSVSFRGLPKTPSVPTMSGAFPQTTPGHATPTPQGLASSDRAPSDTVAFSSTADYFPPVMDSILDVTTSSMTVTATSMIPQICPTVSDASTIMQSSHFLLVKLTVKICLFDVQLFLAEFHCVYIQFNPENAAIQSISNSPMELQLYLQDSTLNENFIENLFQVWHNETRRNEVFSAQMRYKIANISYPSVIDSSTKVTNGICPTYKPSVGILQQSPTYLVVELSVAVCLFNVHLFLSEFYCEYSRFDPGSVVIKSILSSKMEIQIFLDKDFVDNLFQVWHNETRRNAVFSDQIRHQVTNITFDSIAVRSSVPLHPTSIEAPPTFRSNHQVAASTSISATISSPLPHPTTKSTEPVPPVLSDDMSLYMSPLDTAFTVSSSSTQDTASTHAFHSLLPSQFQGTPFTLRSVPTTGKSMTGTSLPPNTAFMASTSSVQAVNSTSISGSITHSRTFMTSSVRQICPTYVASDASVQPLHNSGASDGEPSFYLIVQLISTVHLFKFQRFLAEFRCVYSQFDPGRVIQSIPNSKMEIQIFLLNPTLNNDFVESLLTIWQNVTKRNEVFSKETRDQISNIVSASVTLSSSLPSQSQPMPTLTTTPISMSVTIVPSPIAPSPIAPSSVLSSVLSSILSSIPPSSASLPPTTASTPLPTTPRQLPSRYLILKLGVPTAEFNGSLFLAEFNDYFEFKSDDIVIESVPDSERELRIYVLNNTDKNDQFIDNFETLWETPTLRQQYFGLETTGKIVGYDIAPTSTSKDDGLPGWGVALIVLFTLLAIAIALCLVYVHAWSKRTRHRRRQSNGVAPSHSFHMKKVPGKEGVDGRQQVRRFTSRIDSSSRLQVQTRPLDVAGLGKALQAEDELIVEFQGIPVMMASEDEAPRDCQSKNRYNNVLPSPKTRVPLFLRFGQPTSDYINANYVRGFDNSPKAYIATQGPISSTIDDFWRMVWEQNSSVILMATGLTERDVPKCTQYWPDGKEQKNLFYGDLEVTFISSEEKETFIRTKFVVSHMEKQSVHEVVHYWFKSWPDFGVPEDPADLTGYLEAANEDIKASQGPIIVHCSAGIGRTGVIIATHIGMQDLEASRHCDVLQTVWLIRQDRGGSVQTKDQYIYIYMALYAYGTYFESLDKLKQEPNYEQVVGSTAKAVESENDQTQLLLSSKPKENKVELPSSKGSEGLTGDNNGKSREVTPLIEVNQDTEEPTSKNTKHVKLAVADTSVWA